MSDLMLLLFPVVILACLLVAKQRGLIPEGRDRAVETKMWLDAIHEARTAAKDENEQHVAQILQASESLNAHYTAITHQLINQERHVELEDHQNGMSPMSPVDSAFAQRNALINNPSMFDEEDLA